MGMDTSWWEGWGLGSHRALGHVFLCWRLSEQKSVQMGKVTIQNCRLSPVQVRRGEKGATAARHSGPSLDKGYIHKERGQKEINTEGSGLWGPRKGNARRG